MPARAELVKVLGAEAVRRLVQTCGGQRIYVPVVVGGQLVMMLGCQTAERLSNHWGGEKLDVPT